jgi:SepF-like predicted cell division protein (DUF552 family)
MTREKEINEYLKSKEAIMDEKSDREQQAVIYIRVARVREDSDQAAITQREACQRIAERHGLTVIREYADLGIPARLEQQTELRQLLDHLAIQCDAAYVVVWDHTRLSRDLRTLDDIVERIRVCGAQVITLTGVESAERFTQGGSLLEALASSEEHPPPALYPLGLLRAALRGLAANQSLAVSAILPTGETIHGTVIGTGSRLSINATDGRLIEDVKPEWVTHCGTTPHITHN